MGAAVAAVGHAEHVGVQASVVADGAHQVAKFLRFVGLFGLGAENPTLGHANPCSHHVKDSPGDAR